MKAATADGKILVENVNTTEGASSISLELKARNGDIKINMNDPDERGYKIKARTSNGGVNLLVPGLKYTAPIKQTSTGRYIEASTEDYENYHYKVNIDAETHNGYIEIVK